MTQAEVSSSCKAENAQVGDELTLPRLIERCQQRPPDEAAWSEFVRRFDESIRAHVARTYRARASMEGERRPQFPDDLIEDLVQAVYLRLIEQDSRALGKFEGNRENSIYFYLGIISMNVVRDFFREAKAYKRPKVSFSLDELLEEERESGLLRNAISDLQGRPAASHNSRFTMEEIEAALSKSVSPRHRHRDALIFKLRYLDGLTLEEIQKALGLDISTVGIGSILNRINLRLKKRLQR
jgi:RNA polymerase sigma factor (sigma-70 family)